MKNTLNDNILDTSGDHLLHGVGLLSSIPPEIAQRIKRDALRQKYIERMRSIVRG